MFQFLKANSSQTDVALRLQWIIEGKPYVWDDFTSVPIRDPQLDDIRLKVLALKDTHSPTTKGAYLNETGLAILETIMRDLRTE